MTTEKREIKNLMELYPRQALQGKKLMLDSGWKRGFTLLMAIEMVNAKFMRQLQVLGEQISDSFNDKFDKGTPMQLDSEAERNLKLMFRLKSSFNASANYITNTMQSVDKLMLPEKELAEKDLYAYYISSKGVLEQMAEEKKKLAVEIDRSASACFASEKARLPEMERQALEGIKTKEDIEQILKRISQSLDIELV